MTETPPHQRIADHLRTRIQTHEFLPGVILPSEADLASQYAVAQGTLRSALAILIDEALLQASPGCPLRVAPLDEEPTDRVPPAYRRLMTAIHDRIITDQLTEADRLPSESDLMVEFRVSRNTARRAYQELAYQGVVTVRHGIGAFPTPGFLSARHVAPDGSEPSGRVQGGSDEICNQPPTR